MLCKFCQENVRGTPCQTASQSAKCVNNRDNDWPDDDRYDYKNEDKTQTQADSKEKEVE